MNWRLPKKAWAYQRIRDVLKTPRLWHLRRQLRRARGGAEVNLAGCTFRIAHGANTFVMYNDIFLKKIYHFESTTQSPVILDCGSNIGLSVAYFKQCYPRARVHAFEADPVLGEILKDNLKRNQLVDVGVTVAALSGNQKVGAVKFYSDGLYGGHIADHGASTKSGWSEYQVPTVRLRDYLVEPIHFLKMNIEGEELAVLEDAEDRLQVIQQMVIEYHHLPGKQPSLHKLLELLDQHGFTYLINDLDEETNPAVKPPFHLDESTTYFLLIYACQLVQQ